MRQLIVAVTDAVPDEPAPYVYEEVNAPESELIKRVKESGHGDLLQAIEEVIKFQNQQLFTRLDEERKQRERAEQERQKALLNNISHALNQNLPKLLEKALNKQFKTLAASMNKVVGQLIEANLLKQLQEGLKKLFFQVRSCARHVPRDCGTDPRLTLTRLQFHPRTLCRASRPRSKRRSTSTWPPSRLCST